MSLAANAAKATSLLSDAVFTKSLSAMIKGIRSTKDKNQHEYIAGCLAEIKKELTSTDPDYKVEALKKLIFLQMMGYDMGWASFHIIEVMSLPWYGHRRVGFLAAGLAFNQTTDVILLTTNLLQKAFQQQSLSGPMIVQNPKLAEGVQYEVGAAIACFASIVTPTLANDLLNDVLILLNNPKPYIRKRAIIALYSIFHKHPPALRLAFDQLLDRLNDDNTGVSSSVVYVLCELCSKTPKSYLDLAPHFFHILTSSSNNWVLIKVVKIMGYLVPYEPRLAKKLQEPLSSIITTTPAKSLMYECINTLLCGQITSRAVVRLCLDKLRELVESPDQNLKYLGLLGLNKLIHSFPRIVVQHKDLILNCLNDNDITIRTRALDLVTHLVTPGNLPSVVKKLLNHIHALSDANTNTTSSSSVTAGNTQYHTNQYHNTVIAKILELCTQDQYSMIADFEWFFYTLLEFTKIRSINYENVLRIHEIIKDLLLSIPDLRPFAVNQLCLFLLGFNNNSNSSQNQQQVEQLIKTNNYISTCHLLQDIYQHTLLHELQLTETIGHYNTMTNTTSKLKKQALQQIHNQKQYQYKLISSSYIQCNPMIELLSILAWGIGEYVEFAHSHILLLQCLLLHPAIPYLSSNVQNAFIYSAIKVLCNTFQQPFFTTLDDVKAYEAEQKEKFLEDLEQAKELKKNSILPDTFDINDEANYKQKLKDDGDEDDDDEDDEDEDDDDSNANKKVKGAIMSLTALGHNMIIGRTFAQHVAFLEQSCTIVLSGLNMYLYHTPYPEVQDRAHIFFNYMIYVFGLLGPEFNINNTIVGGSNSNNNTPAITNNNNNDTTTLSTPAKQQQQQQNNNNNNNGIVDLTSLIFKEQQQTNAMDSLIGVTAQSPTNNTENNNDDDDNINNTNNNNNDNDTTSFDPLALLEKGTTNVVNATTTDNNITTIDENNNNNKEKEYSLEFQQLIQTHVQYFAPLFIDELQPISNKTQRKVPIPAGLDLEECLYDFELDAKDKPLFDDKTHPLFPTGTHFITQNYISSKDFSKREQNNKQVASPVVQHGAKDGTSFSAADFDDMGNTKTNDTITSSGKGGYNDDDDDDDLFMSKDALNSKKKKNRFGGGNNDSDDDIMGGGVKNKKKGGNTTNAAIESRHKGDPFYIGGGKTNTGNNNKKNNKIKDPAALTLDDLDFDGPGVNSNNNKADKKKAMAIKKTTTKALVDDDDEGDDLFDLLGPSKKSNVVEKPTKKVVKKKKAATNAEEDVPEKPTKKVIKKKKAAADADEDTNNNPEQEQQPQQPQQVPQSPSNTMIAQFEPPAGSIVIYKTNDVSVYARARPFISGNDNNDSSAITQPIVLIAITIVLNPENDNNPSIENNAIPMFQFTIHGNKSTQLLQSPVPQQYNNNVQIVVKPNNILHVQAKGISTEQQQSSITAYFAIQWNTNNISTSSRYFNYDLKMMFNNNIIQYINPTTNVNLLTLPTSIFIQPNKIQMSDVQYILTQPTTTCTTISTYIAQCTTQQQIMRILKGIEIALNVALIEAVNKTAIYYGRCVTLSPDQSHICVYVKCTDDLRVHITIKTAVQVLSDKLQQDVVQLLQLDNDDDDEEEEEQEEGVNDEQDA